MPPAAPKRSIDVLTPEFWVTFWRHLTEDALHSALQIGGILLTYILLRLLLFRVLDGLLAHLLSHDSRFNVSEERTARLQTLRGLSKSILSYLLVFVFGALLLRALGFDILPFITTAGVLGLAVGFGAQKLVKDVISGFFIVVDNLYVVGDMVTIGTVTGQVEELGMRVTRLVDATGRLYQISNGDIGTVTNLSRNPLQDFIEINVSELADLHLAIQAINEAGKTLFAQPDHHLHEAPQVQGVTAFSAAAVTLRVSVVTDPVRLLTEQMRVRGAARDALIAAQIALA